MNKQSVRKIVIDVMVLGIAITIGIVFKDKLVQQPAELIQLHNPNWFIAIPFMLGMLCLIGMGYLVEKKVRNQDDYH
jgi:hypothetical protein